MCESQFIEKNDLSWLICSSLFKVDQFHQEVFRSLVWCYQMLRFIHLVQFVLALSIIILLYFSSRIRSLLQWKTSGGWLWSTTSAPWCSWPQTTRTASNTGHPRTCPAPRLISERWRSLWWEIFQFVVIILGQYSTWLFSSL